MRLAHYAAYRQNVYYSEDGFPAGYSDSEPFLLEGQVVPNRFALHQDSKSWEFNGGLKGHFDEDGAFVEEGVRVLAWKTVVDVVTVDVSTTALPASNWEAHPALVYDDFIGGSLNWFHYYYTGTYYEALRVDPLFSSGDDHIDFGTLSSSELSWGGWSEDPSPRDAEGDTYYVFGNSGNDWIKLPSYPSVPRLWDVDGGVGNDTMLVGAAVDSTLRGGYGDDKLYAGTNLIHGDGSAAGSWLWGGPGSDEFHAYSGYVEVHGDEIGSDPSTHDADTLYLPGNSADYEWTDRGSEDIWGTWIQSASLDVDTTGLEKVIYADGFLAKPLTFDNFYVEMANLAKHVYDPSNSPPIDDAWGTLNAQELGLGLIRETSGPNPISVEYRMIHGLYTTQSRFVDEAAAAEVMIGSDHGKQTLALVFRGTDSKLAEMLADASYWVDMDSHYWNFRPLLDKVDEFVQANHIEQVFVTGHSLGASMVSLYMAKHADTASTIYRAATFANPGAFDLANVEDQRVLNFLHTDDIIRAVPYNRPGVDILMPRNDVNDWSDDQSFSPTDHSMTNYLLSVTQLNNIPKRHWSSVMSTLIHDQQIGYSVAAGSAESDPLGGEQHKNTDRDLIFGLGGDDKLRGYLGKDTLYGGNDDDRLYGGEQGDLLIGEKGRDTLFGGDGRDVFGYLRFNESRPGIKTIDTIADFHHFRDKIDLSEAEHAFWTRNQHNLHFQQVEARGFSGNKIGQIIWYRDGGATEVRADLDGDGRSDFGLHLIGSMKLTVGDFIL